VLKQFTTQFKELLGSCNTQLSENQYTSGEKYRSKKCLFQVSILEAIYEHSYNNFYSIHGLDVN